MSGWRLDKKLTVEESRSLSTSNLRDWGVLKPTVGFAKGTSTWTNAAGEEVASVGYEFSQDPRPRLRLMYSVTRPSDDGPQSLDYIVHLLTTRCNFGGLRYWFVCPLVVEGQSCQRNVVKLYLPSGATYFGCRHCYNLTYESCQEHDPRVDQLVKNPWLLRQMFDSPNPSQALIAIKALARLDRA